MRGASLLVMGVCAGSVYLCAQYAPATLSGRVTDATQAAIPSAAIAIARSGFNQSLEVRTSDDGSYVLPLLEPGAYTLQVSARGFKTLKQDNIVLKPADKLELPLVLEIGDMAERVTVSADRELLQTSTASRSQRFDPVKIKEFPLIGRQAYQLMGLSPGVLFTQEQAGTNGFAGLRGWDATGKYIINGGREGTNQFLLNGAPISLTGKWQVAPNLEAIQEFKVMTNTYDAQFGRTGGGTVNTTLRSGTNGWHGTVFEWFHNARFDANSTQNNREGAPHGKHNTHQFGGVLGGPIRKDKDFVLLSFEGFREIVPFPIVSDTPHLDLRDGQHFADYGIRIFDPLTAHTCRPGTDTQKGPCYNTFIRNQFPNNVIPQSRISPVGRAILSLYPEPNAYEFNDNYFATANTGRYRYDQPMVRWDHTLGQKDRFYTLFTFQQGSEFQSFNGFPAPAEVGYKGSERRDQNYIAEWTHVISPNTVLDLRASFGRFTEYFPESTDFDFTADKLGIKNFPHAPTTEQNTAPRINLDLFSSIIGNSFSWSTQNQWDLTPSLVQMHGRHMLHYGFEFVYAGLGNTDLGRANGQFSFTRAWTQQYVNRGRGVTDGSGVADLLLGMPASGFIDYNGSFYRTWPYYAGYIQDNWRVAPKLTLNLGLRYDVQIPFVERFNRINSGFDFNTKNPYSDEIIAKWKTLKAEYDAKHPKWIPYPDPPAAIYGGKIFATDQNRRPYDTDWTNIQPRLGVAWQLAPKTVLRAGAGIFHRTATEMNFTDGFSQRTNYINSLDGVKPSAGLTGRYSLEDPFPDGIIAPSGGSLGLITGAGRALSFDGRQRVIPRTFQYSLGFQRELPGSIVLDATYAGSQTVHDRMPVQLNAVPYDLFLRGAAQPNFLNRSLKNPYFGFLPANADIGGGANITAENLLRPLPIFRGITQTTNPWAKYRYDSLQIQMERRFLDSAQTGILTFLLTYTFSKSFEASHRLNAWNLREKPVHELTALDKPHTLGLAGVWDLPVGWGRRWLNNGNRLAGAFTNGWTVDWIFTYYSGYPVAKPDAYFVCSSYFAPGAQTASQWFNNNRKCYQQRRQYSLRTAEDRFSNIRNPSAPQLNLSIEKTFWLGEKYTFQLRGEAFNVTNTPIMGAPNTNFQDPRFGQLPPWQTNFPRFIQFGAKISF